MRLFTTKIKAIDPLDGKLKTWSGVVVPGINWDDAERYCQQNGFGYCEVDGELISMIDERTGKKTNFENLN